MHYKLIDGRRRRQQRRRRRKGSRKKLLRLHNNRYKNKYSNGHIKITWGLSIYPKKTIYISILIEIRERSEGNKERKLLLIKDQESISIN